jgi:hypothetical protein
VNRGPRKDEGQARVQQRLELWDVHDDVHVGVRFNALLCEALLVVPRAEPAATTAGCQRFNPLRLV